MERLEEIDISQSEDTDNQSFTNPRIDRGYTTTFAGVLLMANTFTTGVIYVVLQWFRQENIQDSVFVSMLIAATMILVIGIIKLNKYIVNKGLNLCIFLQSKSNADKR